VISASCPSLSWPDVSIAEAVWVCVDVETTGLEVGEGHRVCEVGAVKGRLEGAVEEFASLVDPRRPLDPGAARVSGLSEADLADAPLFREIATSALGFLSGGVLVAHNAPFDAGFLESELHREGLRLPQVPIVDTTVIAQTVLGLPVRNLAGVSQALGLASQPTHRGLGDARAAREVLLRGLRRLAEWGAATVGEVIDALLPAIPSGLPLADDPLPALRAALKTGCDLQITYLGRKSQGERLVRPIRLEEKAGAFLLEAWCRERQAPRTFRLDRIAMAALAPA
jgi:DNA polymerase-3 subunit epsilon